MKGCDYRKFISIITPEENQCLTLNKTDVLLTQFPPIQIDVYSTYLTYEMLLNNSSVLIWILNWNMKYLLPENIFQYCVTRQFSSESICSFFLSFIFFLFRSDQISCSVMSDSLRPHELQHARPPCPSPTP